MHMFWSATFKKKVLIFKDHVMAMIITSPLLNEFSDLNLIYKNF